MPQSRSAAKNLRKNAKRKLWNKSKRSAARTLVKRVLAAVAAGDLERAKKELPLAMKRLDKAAKTRAVHPNLASRKKSTLSRAVAALEKRGAGKASSDA